jgi:hypothetical protein
MISQETSVEEVREEPAKLERQNCRFNLIGVKAVLVASFSVVMVQAHPAMLSASVPEMNICSVPLALGMAKSIAIDKLSQTCKMTKVPELGADTWLVEEKFDGGTGVGIVEFEAGQTSAVKRSWVPAKDDYGAEDFARGLISAVESGLQGRSGAVGTVSYVIKREPATTMYLMRLALPDEHRQVEVVLMEDSAKSDGKRVRMLDVLESIGR